MTEVEYDVGQAQSVFLHGSLSLKRGVYEQPDLHVFIEHKQVE